MTNNAHRATNMDTSTISTSLPLHNFTYWTADLGGDQNGLQAASLSLVPFSMDPRDRRPMIHLLSLVLWVENFFNHFLSIWRMGLRYWVFDFTVPVICNFPLLCPPCSATCRTPVPPSSAPPTHHHFPHLFHSCAVVSRFLGLST